MIRRRLLIKWYLRHINTNSPTFKHNKRRFLPSVMSRALFVVVWFLGSLCDWKRQKNTQLPRKLQNKGHLATKATIKLNY